MGRGVAAAYRNLVNWKHLQVQSLLFDAGCIGANFFHDIFLHDALHLAPDFIGIINQLQESVTDGAFGEMLVYQLLEHDLLIEQETPDNAQNQDDHEVDVQGNDGQVCQVDEIVELILIQEHSDDDREGAYHRGRVVDFVELGVEVGRHQFLEDGVEEYRQENENSLDLDVFGVVDQEEHYQQLFRHLHELPVIGFLPGCVV